MENQELILEYLKEQREDHKGVSKTLAELGVKVENLREDVQGLANADRDLHDRISRKDDRVQALEVRVTDDEKKFSALKERIETTEKNMKFWVGSAFTVLLIIVGIIEILTK